MDNKLKNYLKKELRELRKKPNPFLDTIPVKNDSVGNQWVEPVWYFLSTEEINILQNEIDKEEQDFKNETAIKAEILREEQVNGKQKMSWFNFEYWWGF